MTQAVAEKQPLAFLFEKRPEPQKPPRLYARMNGHIIGQLAVLVVVTMLGLVTAQGFHAYNVAQLVVFVTTAMALLCFGIYMAIVSIDKQDAIDHMPLVVIALFAGVLAKYLLIFYFTISLTGDPRYVVWGMTTAQIDPLLAAAVAKDERVPKGVRTVLRMWAAMDDPATAALMPLLIKFAGVFGYYLPQADKIGSAQQVLLPFALAIGLVSLFLLVQRLGMLRSLFGSREAAYSGRDTTVGVVGSLSVALRWPIVMAVVAWFVRPKWALDEKFSSRALNAALLIATFMLGVLMADGVDWYGGVVLGLSTFVSHILVTIVIIGAANLWLNRGKRRRLQLSLTGILKLALGQQNGITAIILSLNAEVYVPGSVAVVSVAIMVTNLTNYALNAVFDRCVAPTTLQWDGAWALRSSMLSSAKKAEKAVAAFAAGQRAWSPTFAGAS